MHLTPTSDFEYFVILDVISSHWPVGRDSFRIADFLLLQAANLWQPSLLVANNFVHFLLCLQAGIVLLFSFVYTLQITKGQSFTARVMLFTCLKPPTITDLIVKAASAPCNGTVKPTSYPFKAAPLFQLPRQELPNASKKPASQQPPSRRTVVVMPFGFAQHKPSTRIPDRLNLTEVWEKLKFFHVWRSEPNMCVIVFVQLG